ncbi:MAG: DUF1566 domain-containing protein [bacterium]|nr:DUF1566 domain-containing protein [bacterium]
MLPEIGTSPLLILVDQFEEVYSLCPDLEERRQTIDNLLTAASDPSGHVSVILTLRSDFLGHTQNHPDLNHAIAAQGVIVPVMNDTELRQAIARPAELAGQPLEAAAIDLLIAQSAGREGALPLLQFALTRIWEGLAEGIAPAETLKAIGGVGGALAGEAQRLYDKLAETDKAIARRAFLALVQLGEGTQDTRRRAAVPEIIAHGEDPGHVAAVLRVFAQPGARLVTLSADSQSGATAEVTHEALLSHWTSLKEWLDSSRDDLRFHRRAADAATYWDEQKQPDGLLWRPPDLDLLHDFHARAGQDMTPTQVQFFQASVRRVKHSQWLKRVMIAVVLIFAIAAGTAAYFAVQSSKSAQKNAQEAAIQKNTAIHQSRISLIRSVIGYSYKEDAQNHRKRAALMARQAQLLNQRFEGGDTVEQEIEAALRTIFRTEAILAGPKHYLEKAGLLELVCRNVDHTKVLTDDKWTQFFGDDIKRELTCPDTPDVLQLRSEAMTTTTDMEALSLNLREESGAGYPIEYIENEFKVHGEVIVDGATGLMWQQSGSGEEKTHADAQSYCDTLELAGKTDWRLPTVEELLSLIEKEAQPNETTGRGRHIDSRFDGRQSYVWSSDLRRIESEGSAGSAWYVVFSSGPVSWNFVKGNLYVRCVRS